MKAVSHPIAIGLLGHHPVERLYLPSVGHSRAIIVLRDPQVLELADICIGLFFVYCKFVFGGQF